MIYRSFSSTATRKLGTRIARELLHKRPHRARARMIGLSGELGSGKTTFVIGFARGLGVRGRVQSPTFIMVRRMPIMGRKAFTNLYHVDAYRLRRHKEASAIGLGEMVRDPKAVVLIEWPERIRRLLPRGTVIIAFRHGNRENERVIETKKSRP